MSNMLVLTKKKKRSIWTQEWAWRGCEDEKGNWSDISRISGMQRLPMNHSPGASISSHFAEETNLINTFTLKLKPPGWDVTYFWGISHSLVVLCYSSPGTGVYTFWSPGRWHMITNVSASGEAHLDGFWNWSCEWKIPNKKAEMEELYRSLLHIPLP